MKKLSSLKQSGFTLIELLIVIALLGALAVGLLAALDPLEQIKKGTDTGTRNQVTEIHQAILRYYAIKGSMPFAGSLAAGAIGTDTTGTVRVALQSVIDSGELKTDFMTSAAQNLDKIYITGIDNGTLASVAVCYSPTSKSFRSENNTKYGLPTNFTLDSLTGCPNANGTSTAGGTCYWCVQ